VYKATLKNGQDVAVKVQRPSILREIALDLYILRLLTPLQVYLVNFVRGRKTFQDDIDVALSFVDEWGRVFVAEVDYKLEAKNAEEFLNAMESRGLNAVTCPAVVKDFSTSKIIVTEWIEGTRLDRDTSPDVPRLCNVAVNAYLTMLLDTGVLHCDPHPGNLLRTVDGRLCVLDWGMTLAVPSDLQYAILEFIAHINTEDFDAIPEDFVNLGFSPAGKVDLLRSSGMTEGIALTFRQLNKGGGVKKIGERVKEEFKSRYGSNLSNEELRNKAREEVMERLEEQLKGDGGVDVKGVTGVMEEMSRSNRDIFKLPPYILYVSRAFSTLEGIGTVFLNTNT
jgi:predicted unusual protein kinase regulating ubiquinone biosynthesis (AarF/ABC1/UbiB family)